MANGKARVSTAHEALRAIRVFIAVLGCALPRQQCSGLDATKPSGAIEQRETFIRPTLWVDAWVAGRIGEPPAEIAVLAEGENLGTAARTDTWHVRFESNAVLVDFAVPLVDADASAK
jgi:hypothetical protein